MKMMKNVYQRYLLLGFLLCGVCIIGFQALFSQTRVDASVEMARESFKGGLKLFNSYSYLGAVEYFRQSLVNYPDYHTAREYLARSYRLAGYTDEALKEWELLYELSGDPAVKNKIDFLRYNSTSGEERELSPSEYIEYREIGSRTISHYQFPYPTDLALDSEKKLYITSFTSGKIVKINPDGDGIKIKKGNSESRIFALDIRDGRLIYSDFARDLVIVTDLDFNTILSIGGRGDGPGEFYGPQGVCFDSDGNFYVVDTGNNRVQKFSSDGTFLFDFGIKGSYEGEFQNPTDLAVINKTVFVSDTDNGRVCIYDDSGNFLDVIKGDFLVKPRMLSVRNKMLYIADPEKGLVFYNTQNGKVEILDSWNGGDKTFSRVYSSAFDRDGYLYALDHDIQRVTLFSPVTRVYTNLDLEINAVDVSRYPVVAFFVSVKDRLGKPVHALSPDDFSVVEDSARIKDLDIDYFQRKDKGLDIIFAVDRSLASKEWHDELVWAGDHFLSHLHREDRLKVVGFNEDYVTLNDYDWSRRRALKVLREMSFEGSKDLGRVIYNNINDLVKRDKKRAVVIVTDGEGDDSSFSQYDAETIVDYARCHYIPLSFISLNKDNALLRDIASKTGGLFVMAKDLDTLDTLYGYLKSREENRYVIIYQTFKGPEYRGWWSDVKLEVNSKGQIGREWGGYFVP